MSNVKHNFGPRTIEVVDEETGVVSEVLAPIPSTGNFDEYYYDVEVKQIVKPLEGSDDDFIIDIKEVITKRSVKETIESQSDDVGLDAMLERFKVTGDPSVLPTPVKATDKVLDLTQLPSDSAEFFMYMHNLYENFEKIPIELRKDLKMSEFAASIKDSDIDSYIDSLKKKEIENKEGDK